MNDLFRKIARSSSDVIGSPKAFVIAVLIVILWGLSGTLFGYSDTWQLVINTGTTIITFLMLFLVQNTQNRDGKAIHLKLDELIHSMHNARNKLIDIEEQPDLQISELHSEFKGISEKSEKMREAAAMKKVVK